MKPIFVTTTPRPSAAGFTHYLHSAGLPRVLPIGVLVGILLFLCPSLPAQSKPPDPPSEILGTWEGESKCTISDSPCRDEHVVYEITPERDKSASTPLKMDGYKVVNGERQFMGTLRCDYDSAKKNLSCTFRGKIFDDWQYTLSGLILQGTLTTDAGKTLYRKITVKKNSKN
jgi:hypothetical protein